MYHFHGEAFKGKCALSALSMETNSPQVEMAEPQVEATSILESVQEVQVPGRITLLCWIFCEQNRKLLSNER